MAKTFKVNDIWETYKRKRQVKILEIDTKKGIIKTNDYLYPLRDLKGCWGMFPDNDLKKLISRNGVNIRD